MLFRTLGNDGMKVSALGLGCMGMSQFYGQTDDHKSLEVLEKAVDLGVNLFDTSDMYGNGHNEELLGKLIKTSKSKIRIATKFGIKSRSKDGDWVVDNSPEYIRQSCDASLKRLGIDCIDLYYIHRLNKEQPLDETINALAELVKSGKIRHIGLSEVSAETIIKAHNIFPITAIQSEYSLWTRDVEHNGILSTCRNLGIGFVPYSPLGRGFLTGTIKSIDNLDTNDFRKASPRFQKDNIEKNLEAVRTIENIAENKGCTTSQIALSWVLSQGNDIIPIPGTKRIKYLEQNVESVDIKLSDNELKLLDTSFTSDNITGSRYSESAMKALPY